MMEIRLLQLLIKGQKFHLSVLLCIIKTNDHRFLYPLYWMKYFCLKYLITEITIIC